MRRGALGALAVALFAFGCASKKPIIPPEKLWGEAETAFHDEAYELAVDRFPSSPWAEKARLRVRECREALAKHEADIARYYLRQKNLKAAEARLRGLLTEYPETEATAEALYSFAQAYAARDESEGATLALATLVKHHPDGPLGREAKQRLGDASVSVDGEDPLRLLVARIDRMRQQADRQKLPNTVSAYPDI